MIGADRPRVEPGLRYIHRVEDGTPFYVVKDPVRMRYFRFGDVEVGLMRLLDGERTIDEVAAELGARTESVAAFVARLKEMGLVERTLEERSVLLMESLRRDRTLRLEGHGNTLLRWRFPFGDPDRLFDRVIGRLGFFFTPAFIAVSIAAFAVYFIILMLHRDAVAAGIAMLYDPRQYTVPFVVGVYTSAAVLFGAHELGHGLTCKRFGGEVHEIGAMLFYFSPAFYCNINDAWTFEKLSHRLWVTFAGGWIQLLLGSVAAVLWIVAEPGTIVEQLAFAGVLLGGGIILLVNFNPLIPLDGYYALMDWLRIPNLRPRSFRYLGAWFRRHVLRLATPVPTVTPRERRIFLVYGSLSLLYTGLLIATVAFFVGGLVVRALGGWGWALIGLVAWRVGRSPSRSAGRTLRVWAADKLGPAALRPAALGTGAGLLLILAIGLLPWTLRATGLATVEPLERVWLRPTESALVDRVLVREGDTVPAGTPVLVLRSPELDVEIAALDGGIAALEREREGARSRGADATARRTGLELDARREDRLALDRRRAALVLRAPFDAVVATPHLEELAGARVEAGDSVVQLWRPGHLRVRVALAQRDGGDVRPGAPVAVRFPVDAGVTWRTTVARVGPAARGDGAIEAIAPLGEPVGLRPGMVGPARIELDRIRVADAAVRALRRTFRTDWLL